MIGKHVFMMAIALLLPDVAAVSNVPYHDWSACSMTCEGIGIQTKGSGIAQRICDNSHIKCGFHIYFEKTQVCDLSIEGNDNGKLLQCEWRGRDDDEGAVHFYLTNKNQIFVNSSGTKYFISEDGNVGNDLKVFSDKEPLNFKFGASSIALIPTRHSNNPHLCFFAMEVNKLKFKATACDNKYRLAVEPVYTCENKNSSNSVVKHEATVTSERYCVLKCANRRMTDPTINAVVIRRHSSSVTCQCVLRGSGAINSYSVKTCSIVGDLRLKLTMKPYNVPRDYWTFDLNHFGSIKELKLSDVKDTNILFYFIGTKLEIESVASNNRMCLGVPSADVKTDLDGSCGAYKIIDNKLMVGVEMFKEICPMSHHKIGIGNCEAFGIGIENEYISTTTTTAVTTSTTTPSTADASAGMSYIFAAASGGKMYDIDFTSKPILKLVESSNIQHNVLYDPVKKHIKVTFSGRTYCLYVDTPLKIKAEEYNGLGCGTFTKSNNRIATDTDTAVNYLYLHVDNQVLTYPESAGYNFLKFHDETSSTTSTSTTTPANTPTTTSSGEMSSTTSTSTTTTGNNPINTSSGEMSSTTGTSTATYPTTRSSEEMSSTTSTSTTTTTGNNPINTSSGVAISYSHSVGTTAGGATVMSPQVTGEVIPSRLTGEVTTKQPTITLDYVFHGTLESSSHTTKCSKLCERGVTRSIRKCVNKAWMPINNLPSNACVKDEIVETNCLELTHCSDKRMHLADGGISCQQFCNKLGLLCSPKVETGNSEDAFRNIILSYTIDHDNERWTNNYGPYCQSGVCSEFIHVPENVPCIAKPPSALHQRLCVCLGANDVGYGPWSPWSVCSVTCGGHRTRSRNCFGDCTGRQSEETNCSLPDCPIHGGLSPWNAWSSCNKTCGGGHQIRTRTCNNPAPSSTGNNCIGDLIVQRVCNVHYCPVDAAWGSWSVMSGCDKPCNTGEMSRRRVCKRALYNGREICPGPAKESIICNTHTCPSTTADLKLHFNDYFVPELYDPQSNAYKEFKENLESQIIESFSYDFPNSIHDVVLHKLEPGSIIANFTITFVNFDSYQFLYLQDSIEVEKTIGKLLLLEATETTYAIYPDVPSAAPSNIEIVSLSPTSFNISWTAVPGENITIKCYIIFYREKMKTSSPYNSLASSNGSLSVDLGGLKPGTLYVFRILAYSENGNGVSSRLITKSTLEKLPAVPPTNVTAEGGMFSAFVEWVGVSREDMNGVPLGYHIYYHSDGIARTATANFTSRNIVITNLLPSTLYIFKVCAFNKIGDGPCDRVLATTFDSVPTAAPNNLMVEKNRTHDSLTITWDIPSMDTIYGDLLGFLLQYRVLKHKDVIADGTKEFKRIKTHPSITRVTLLSLIPNTDYEISVAAINQFGTGVFTATTSETCKCPETVSASFYEVKPYAYHTDDGGHKLFGVFSSIMDDMVQFACGKCQRTSGIYETKLDKSQDGRNRFSSKVNAESVIQNVDEFTDLNFPIVANTYLDQFMDYPFVPVIEHPGVVLIAKDKSINEIVGEMVHTSFSIWPILIINLFMMVITGFSIWALENYNATKEVDFSKGILKGLGEGWYWAFITQFTQGYGDFVPRCFISRVFTVFWIFIGLIMTSLIIGAITSALTAVTINSQIKIYGSQIGAINASFEEKVGILRNGKVNQKTTYVKVKQLADALLDGYIQAVLIDAYTAGEYGSEFDQPHLRAADMIKFPRSYGFVLSGDLAYVHAEVRDYVTVNAENILMIMQDSTKRMQVVPPPQYKSIFDPRSDISRNTMIALSILLLVSIILGWFYSYLKTSHKKRKIATKPTKKELRIRNHEEMKNLVSDFQNDFQKKLLNLSNKHDIERIKLRFDRGASSLRNQAVVHKEIKKRKRATKPSPENAQFEETDNTGLISTESSSESPRNLSESPENISKSPRNASEEGNAEGITISDTTDIAVDPHMLHDVESDISDIEC